MVFVFSFRLVLYLVNECVKFIVYLFCLLFEGVDCIVSLFGVDVGVVFHLMYLVVRVDGLEVFQYLVFAVVDPDGFGLIFGVVVSD